MSRIYDKKQQREIRHIFRRMNMCGCGMNTEYAVLFSVLTAILERVASDKPLYEAIDDLSERAVEFVAKVATSWNLLEHGSSVGGSWLTEDGKKILEFLREFGDDPGQLEEGPWPDWWCSCDANEEW